MGSKDIIRDYCRRGIRGLESGWEYVFGFRVLYFVKVRVFGCFWAVFAASGYSFCWF